MENVTSNRELKKDFVYKAQLTVDQKLPFLKLNGDNDDIENYLASLSFREGSRLFMEVMKVVNPKAFIPNPDGPVGPVPDPFGILAGKLHIPLSLLGPAFDGAIRCLRCKLVTLDSDEPWDCVEVPCASR